MSGVPELIGFVAGYLAALYFSRPPRRRRHVALPEASAA